MLAREHAMHAWFEFWENENLSPADFEMSSRAVLNTEQRGSARSRAYKLPITPSPTLLDRFCPMASPLRVDPARLQLLKAGFVWTTLLPQLNATVQAFYGDMLEQDDFIAQRRKALRLRAGLKATDKRVP